MIKEAMEVKSKSAEQIDLAFVGQAPSEDSNPSEPLSGRSAEFLSRLLGVDQAAFMLMNRFNLNPLFSGKDGKGDAFDPVVGQTIAHTLLCAPTLRRYVLLGSQVTRCFGLPWDPVCSYDRGDKAFLIMPHPSGINLHWNVSRHREEAAFVLKRFVFGL